MRSAKILLCIVSLLCVCAQAQRESSPAGMFNGDGPGGHRARWGPSERHYGRAARRICDERRDCVQEPRPRAFFG